MTWRPPRGSVQVEPGYYQAPNGSLYQDPVAHEADRVAAVRGSRERARTEHERRKREQPLVLAALFDKTQVLEARLWLTTELLLASQQLLMEKEEALRFEEGLVASLLAEAGLRVRHLREAA